MYLFGSGSVSFSGLEKWEPFQVFVNFDPVSVFRFQIIHTGLVLYANLLLKSYANFLSLFIFLL